MLLNLKTVPRRLAVGLVTVCVGSAAVAQAGNNPVASNPVANTPIDQQRDQQTALAAYIDAQLALQRDTVQGLAVLRSRGHAGPQEYDRAVVELRQLKGRRIACDRFADRLDTFATARVTQTTSSATQTTRDVTQKSDNTAVIASQRPANACPPRLMLDLFRLAGTSLSGRRFVVVNLTDDLRPRLAELRDLQRRQREAQVAAVAARVDYLTQRAARLRQIDRPWLAERAELRQTEQQIRLLNAEIDVIRTTPDAVTELVSLPQFTVEGRTIADPIALAEQLATEWTACLRDADADGRAAQADYLRRYQQRLTVLEASGHSRPGELALFTNALARLSQSATRTSPTTTQPQAAAQPTRDQHIAAGAAVDRAAAQAREARTQAQQVAQLAADDGFFAGERDWRFQTQTLADAKQQRANEQLTLLQALAAASPVPNVTSQTAPDTPPPATTLANSPALDLPSLRNIVAASISPATVATAEAELAIAQQRAAALVQLRAEGHASWNELASAGASVREQAANLAAARLHNQAIQQQIDILDALSDAPTPR